MKPIILIGALSLTLLIFLTPLLSIFFDTHLFEYAYQHNGAEEQVPHDELWAITENFQSWLLGQDTLHSFTANEASHLQDVKSLVYTAKALWLWSLAVLLAVFGIISCQSKRLLLLQRVFDLAPKISAAVLGILFVLSLRWEWFFLTFHKLFFTDNFTFSVDSLLIRLWGGNFFVLAATYIALHIVLISACILLVSFVLKKIILQQSECL